MWATVCIISLRMTHGLQKKQKANPKEEWIIVANTHVALVSREDFKTVQEMMLKKKEKKRKPKNKGAGSVSSFNFFKEKIVRADCGKTMYLRGRVDGNKFFECGNYTLNKKCFSHSVRTDIRK